METAMIRMLVKSGLLTVVVSVCGVARADVDPIAAYSDGVRAMQMDRYAVAEQCFEEAITVGADAQTWMMKGLAERAQGKHSEAQESIHQAASLLAVDNANARSLGLALERVQGPFRLYIEDVRRYYVRTGNKPGDVISGAQSPLTPVEPSIVDPPTTTPVPAKPPYSPPAPQEAIPPSDAPPAEPLRITAAKPATVETVPSVIAGAPSYPVYAELYTPVSQTTAAGVIPAWPVPVNSYAVGVGAWVPAWWSVYPSTSTWVSYGWAGSPFYGVYAPSHPWWGFYPHRSY
jgi:hypothetical protein